MIPPQVECPSQRGTSAGKASTWLQSCSCRTANSAHSARNNRKGGETKVHEEFKQELAPCHPEQSFEQRAVEGAIRAIKNESLESKQGERRDRKTLTYRQVPNDPEG